MRTMKTIGIIAAAFLCLTLAGTANAAAPTDGSPGTTISAPVLFAPEGDGISVESYQSLVTPILPSPAMCIEYPINGIVQCCVRVFGVIFCVAG